MYFLSSPLLRVKGVGDKTADNLAQQNLHTIQDLLLFLPLNYSDLSQIVTIDQLEPEQSYTVKAEVVSVNSYYKNRKKITKATIADHTGQVQCFWFNSRFIKQQLKIGQTFFFAGQYSRYRTFTQPKIEAVKAETLHTGRLVPRYSQTLDIKQGKMRLILKEILSNLKIEDDILSQNFNLLDLQKTLTQLHFPDDKELVIEARKRLAVEELLALIKQSYKSKLSWQKLEPLKKLNLDQISKEEVIPKFLPFKLTNDQIQSINTIVQDLGRSYPMNRLLIGDVGSGKTVVAGIAMHHMIKAGFNCALVAPTQILAEQHWETFKKIFPDLPTKLLTAKTKQTKEEIKKLTKPTLFIGTHAVINQLPTINPALVVFDEQHRFGVAQRAQALQSKTTKHSKKQPHILTMSATPIPRSYMLTIFSHLEVSLIKEFPFGEKNIKTFVVPKTKKQKAFNWIIKQLKNTEKNSKKKSRSKNKSNSTNKSKTKQNLKPLAIIVCPFIDPSDNEAFSNVPAATEVFKNITKEKGKELKISLLHGRQKSAEQEKIIQQLFNQEIDLLITTSIVEVGVDLPQANIMMIEGADRFGLASLHQLRGRVGRQSQESYCLLSSSSHSPEITHRLKLFSQKNDGLKLAELDLENRGPGDLFGLKQHGLDNLMFADWHNLELINQAKEIFSQLNNNKLNWQPFLKN